MLKASGMWVSRLELAPARRLPRSASVAGSGQGEEKPFEPFAIGVGGAIAVDQALLQAGRNDLETGPVERPGCRRELRHHIGAVAPLLDHLDYAADLALSPPQPP